MKLLGLRVKPIYLKLALPLLAVWFAALVWAVQHHLGNERYRLNFLAGGVRGVAEQNAALIDPVAVARISCEIMGSRGGAGGACQDGAFQAGGRCDLRGPCQYRFGAESRRLRTVLREAVKDLQHLPYFSEMYKTLVLGQAGKDRIFKFRVELQRRRPNGEFMQVDAVHVPPAGHSALFGQPVPQYLKNPKALAQATAAWERGMPSEWTTRENYQVFWPVTSARRTDGGLRDTAALLTIQVEREQHSVIYSVGLVLLLSFWFIGVAVTTVATTVLVGVIWLFNFLTIWGVGLVLVVVVALLIWYRKRGG